MRKLKLQIQISLDGFIAGPKGEMDWMEWNWDNKLIQYVTEINETFDCILLGRKLAEGFIPHWANVAANPEAPEHKAGIIFNDTNKIVFSNTLAPSIPIEKGWKNTIIAKDDLVTEITRLKSQDGKDIIAYGGSTFVSDLIKHHLVDEFNLFVNPTAIGNGMTIFKTIESKQKLNLVKSNAFVCGIVVLQYELKRN